MVLHSHLSASPNLWELSPAISGLVSIGTHSLYVSASGPPRVVNSHHPHDPVSPIIIYITGAGGPCATVVRLQRLLSTFTRVIFYDRAGYDRSERGPAPVLDAQQTAKELQTLLRDGINVKPPYVLIAHSYGGIVARAFLDLVGSGKSGVDGLILAETATESMFEFFRPKIPPKELDTIAAGIDLAELTDLKRMSQLTEQEWAAAIAGIERTDPTNEEEDHRGGARKLAELKQYETAAMGDRPLSVIRCHMAKDWWLMYHAGVDRGQGTEEERKVAREMIETFDLFDDEVRASQLRLSNGERRYVVRSDLGHDVVITVPEIVVEEVRWLLGRLKEEDEE